MKFTSVAWFYVFSFWSWESVFGDSACSSQFCVIREASAAVKCFEDSALIPLRNLSFISKRNHHCAKSSPLLKKYNRKVRPRLHSVLLNGSDIVSIACLTSGAMRLSCPLRITLFHFLHTSDFLNVSLFYDGEQYLGEKGVLTCTITWAKDVTLVFKTLFKTEKETLGLSTGNITGPDTTLRYRVNFESLRQKNALEYMCGAKALAFGKIPITVTNSLRIKLRTRVTLASSMSGLAEKPTSSIAYRQLSPSKQPDVVATSYGSSRSLFPLRFFLSAVCVWVFSNDM